MACSVCIVIPVQAGNLLAIERLSVDPSRPHVILAGDRPIFLAGYYEVPDDANPKFPSMNYFLDRNAQYGCNTFRLSFVCDAGCNPYCDHEIWIDNDCGQPNDAYFSWLRNFCSYAADRGIYVVICVYGYEDDWPCNNKTDANREKTYDKILEYTYDLRNVIIETNWEVLIEDYGYEFLYEVADYFQSHPNYQSDGKVLAIVTDSRAPGDAYLGPNKINGRHREWDRDTSLWYWDNNRPTLWTERWFCWPYSGGSATCGANASISEEEARINLYRDALFCGSGIKFYYIRWNAPDHPDLPSSYLEQCGHAVNLSKMLPLADMAPEERVIGFSANGYWLVAPGKCYAGYLENGGDVTVDLSEVSGDADYFWFNPRDGSTTGEGAVSGGGDRLFSAPNSNDWVLVIESTPISQEPYHGAPFSVPCKIEAEDYDLGGEGVAYHDTTFGNTGGDYRNDDVDVDTCNDTGGGYYVGWIDTGEWLEYTVNLASSGSYDLSLRVASLDAGGTFHIEMNGQDVTGLQSFPATGGWQDWVTVTVPNVTLNAGEQILRISMDSASWNLNWIEVILVTVVVLSDFDKDGDVDQEDFGHFQACYTGSGAVYESGCEKADFEGDGDVDLIDFDVFQGCIGGANQPPRC